MGGCLTRRAVRAASAHSLRLLALLLKHDDRESRVDRVRRAHNEGHLNGRAGTQLALRLLLKELVTGQFFLRTRRSKKGLESATGGTRLANLRVQHSSDARAGATSNKQLRRKKMPAATAPGWLAFPVLYPHRRLLTLRRRESGFCFARRERTFPDDAIRCY